MSDTRIDETDFTGGKVVFLGITPGERDAIQMAAVEATAHITDGQAKTIANALALRADAVAMMADGGVVVIEVKRGPRHPRRVKFQGLLRSAT